MFDWLLFFSACILIGDRLVLIRLFREDRPEYMQSPVINYRNEVIAFYIDIHFFPGCPVGQINPLAIIIHMRNSRSASEDMQDEVVVVAVRFNLKVHPTDLQTRYLVELFQVMRKGVFYAACGYVILQQFVFQVLEEWRLVVPQFRLNPVFGI